MSAARSLRRRLEAALARGAYRVLSALPRPCVVALARGLGTLAYWAAPALRRVGRANLDVAFRDAKSAPEKRAILLESCRRFALVILDIFWFARDTRARIGKYVRFEPETADFLDERAAVCLTGHFGNWELLGQAATVRGMKLHSVAMPLKNPAVDEMLIRSREAAGAKIIRRQGAVRRLLEVLRGGGKVALLLDQNTALSEGGIFVDFFGVPATVSPAGAMLACRTGADIVFGFCLPERGGRYRVHAAGRLRPPEPSRGRAGQPVLDLTREITAVYEQQIRKHPENWMWMYKRWKHIRPGDPGKGYPFYSSRLAGDPAAEPPAPF
jgi:lauroyl/myristoyl acyltransferase